MEIAKQLFERAMEAGKVTEGTKFFSVTDKKKVDAGGGEMVDVEVPNGAHRVTIISEEMGKGKSFKGDEQEELQMVILDNGVERQWNVAVKNEEGNLHYIIQALADIEKGEEFIVEAFKMRNGKYGKRITKVAGGKKHDDGIPSIQYDDVGEEDSRAVEGGAHVSDKKIPF